MATITIIRWDDEQFETTFKDEAWVVIDLTGFTIFFTVKSQDDMLDGDSEAKISKTITEFTEDDDETNWVVNILLTHTDTNIPPWDYYWDLQIKSPTWLISSVQRGKFVVEDDTTRRIL